MARRSLVGTNHVVASIVVIALVVSFLTGCASQPAAPAAPAAAPSAPPTVAAAGATTSPAAAAITSAAPVSTQAAQTAAAPETLKVGVVFGTTGPIAPVGIPIMKWLQFGLDEVNARGGVKVAGKTYRFEGIQVDDKATAEGGRAMADTLVLQQKVKYIIGIDPPALAAALPIMNPAKVLNIATASNFAFSRENTPYTFGVISPHTLSTGPILIDWLIKNYPSAKRIAIIREDSVPGRDSAESAVKDAQAKGLTVVAKEFFPTSMKDANPLVTRVLQSSPDAVDSPSMGTPNQWVSIQQALTEQGFKGARYGQSGDQAAMAKGLPFLEGFTTVILADWKWPGMPKMATETINRFLKANPDVNEAAGGSVNAMYNHAWLLAQAMEKAGTVDDTVKLAQTLRDGLWDTTWSAELGKAGFGGEKTFGIKLYLDHPTYLSQVKDGKPQTTAVMISKLP